MNIKHLCLSMLSLLLLIGAGTVSAQTIGAFDQQADWGPRGTNKVPGSASFSNGVYTLEGNGDDIWNNDDEGFFLYKNLEGSWSISGKVAWLDTGGNEWAKIGLMIRDDGEAAGSITYYGILAGGLSTQGDRSDAAWRDSTDGASNSTQIYKQDGSALTQDANGELWLRISYDAVADYGFFEYSEDGTNWIQANRHKIVMDGPNAYGLAITNHDDNTVLARATVSDVQIQQYPGNVYATQSFSGGGAVGGPYVYTSGDTIQVNIQLINTTPDARDATIVETVPNGWTISDINNGGTLSGNEITWSVNVPPGETGVTLSFQATATDSADGPAAFMGTIDGADIEYEGAYTINPLMEEAIGPFTHYADIGNVAAAGSSMGDDSLITVSGSGADIWGTADEFHYLFREITGSFKLRSEVILFIDQGDGTWTKAGLMVRDSLGAHSTNVAALMRSDGDIAMQWRDTQGGESGDSGWSDQNGNYYVLELERIGDTFTFYAYNNAGDQLTVSTHTLPMEDPVFVGFAVTSHNDGSFSSMDYEMTELTIYDVSAERIFSSDYYTPGETITGNRIVVDVALGRTYTGALTETIPEGVTLTNLEATAGTPTISGNTLTWEFTNLSGTAELTFDIEVAETANSSLPFSGSIGDLKTAGNASLLPVLNIPHIARDATLDGIISDGEYDGAAVLLVTHESGDTSAPGVHIDGTPYPADTENATIYTYHNGSTLFVAIDVNDGDQLDFAAANPWEGDSLELYLDGDFSRASGTKGEGTNDDGGAYGFQATVRADGVWGGSGGIIPTPTEVDGAQVSTDGAVWNAAVRTKDDPVGYVVEYAVDLSAALKPVDRELVGFDLAFNSADGGGVRTGKWGYWQTLLDGTPVDAWNNESGWAIARLMNRGTAIDTWYLY
jgi:hypothetical protein